jgi:hypothetical protein
MGWDSMPGSGTGARPRLSIVAALQRAYPDAVAIDASVAKGRAFMAMRCEDGQVRPMYLLLNRQGFINESDPTDDPVWVKDSPIDESPERWPKKVAEQLATWEWT